MPENVIKVCIEKHSISGTKTPYQCVSPVEAMMQIRLFFRRRELVVLMCCLSILMAFINLSDANAANKSAKTFDQRRMNDLKKELQRIDTIGQELKRDHPGDSRPPIEIVKSDIEFEKGFATMLSEQKRDAKAALLLFKTGVFLDKRPRGDRMATVKTANEKLKPYFRVDEHGNIYFLPIISGIPYQFPTVAMTPDRAIKLIEKWVVDNNAQLKIRESQLILLKQEQKLRDELSSLERKAKTVADLWIHDPHLEDTGQKNIYKAVVGTTLRFKIMVRYNDDTDETFTDDLAKGIYLLPSSTLKVDSAKKYKVHVHFSNGKDYPFTVEGYYRQDLISFVKADYRAREGRDEIITIELQREGTGKGKVTARFREILGKGTRAGDYAVIDPFPVWENDQLGKKPIRVKIYDNKDSSYNKVITLQLESTSGADLKYPKSTQITIEDDDMGGSLRIMVPRYNVDETEKTVWIGIERVGERVLNSVTVRVQTLNGSAKEGEDYKAFSDTLTWGPTDKGIKHVEIPIIEDKVEEGAETFHVILSDPTGGAVLDTPNTTEITIRDVKDRQDGIQKARFSRSEYRVGEGGAGIRITVHREGGTQGEFKVDYLTQDAYAQAGEDYETSHGTLTWKDGDDRPKHFMVEIIDDQEPEPRPETIHLQLENPRNPEVSVGFDATGTEAVIYIEDNDSETEEKPPETDTPPASSIGLSAALDCGDSFELAPGDFAGKGCGIVIRGWRGNTEDRVEVRVNYDKSSGLEITPGDWSMSPSNMYTPGTTDFHDRYVLSQSFRASRNARSGTYPVTFTVNQKGTAGTILLRLQVMILQPGQTPSPGPGTRPPATINTGSGGQYCVWRHKMFGDPPPCFHFVAAACNTPRYRQPNYELIGRDMKWSEADAMVSRMSRYQKDEYGCLEITAQQPSDRDGDGTPDDLDGCPNNPKKTAPGFCGCKKPETDRDGDGVPDCIDNCPDNPEKVEPGICGCKQSDKDSDKDGTPDCIDDCADDPNKIKEGICGCNVPDEDKDNNGVIDCLEKKTVFSGMQISPGSAKIKPDGSVSFTAIPIDVNGKPIQGQDLQGLSFEWSVSDPSVANIFGQHNTAVLSPIKDGSVTVICVTSQVNAFATVIIEKEMKGCASDNDCQQGYVCDPPSGKCVPPFDDSYAGFNDQLAQRDDQRTWDNAQQVINDQSANTDKDKYTLKDLDKDLDQIQDYLSVECSDKKPCRDGYSCEDGKCVKKHDDDKQECAKSEDCPKDHECKDGKCVKKTEAKPEILAITPANKAVKINEPVTLQAILKMEDGSSKDVTREATWNPGNPFSKGNIGQYTVKATYKNLSGTAMITVVNKKGMQDITVNSKTINVTCYDHGQYEDGDMIDILINGKVVFAGITLTKADNTEPRSITMDADVIVFGFRALNEGRISPNTATVIFTNVTKGKKEQQYTLKKNQETNMNITYSP